MPNNAASLIGRALQEGRLASATIIYKNKLHKDFSTPYRWKVPFVKRGGNIFVSENHAKVAILENATDTVVFLSSNNWLTNHVYEFTYIIRGTEAVEIARTIRENMTQVRQEKVACADQTE